MPSSWQSGLLVLLCGVAAVSATARLQLKLSGADQVDGVSNFKVVATVTNTGDETLKLLNDPRSPLSKIPTHTISIMHESGAAPDFVGALVCAYDVCKVLMLIVPLPGKICA